VQREQALMGTRFAIRVVTRDETAAAEAIDAAFAEVARIESLISEWRDDSEISQVNRQAGGLATAVGPELYEVVERSVRIGELTGGAFDVSFAGCAGLWSFRERRRPSPDALAACLPAVDYRQIRLDPVAQTIRLLRADARLGLGGIGKGFGVDRAAAVLERHGFWNYVVDGGGDLRVSGRHLERPWRIGIIDPRAPDRLLCTLDVTSGAVVTSGDYERYFDQSGVRYHHILDPATGEPARRAIAVTVLAPDATLADALATGVFVLGPEAGLALVESLEGVEALIVAPDSSVARSSGFGAWMAPFAAVEGE
jgi:FAD:protein FMN transferase